MKNVTATIIAPLLRLAGFAISFSLLARDLAEADRHVVNPLSSPAMSRRRFAYFLRISFPAFAKTVSSQLNSISSACFFIAIQISGLNQHMAIQKTINNLGLEMSAAKLQKSVEATQIDKTQFLKITVKNSNPETAKNKTAIPF